ncbi:MAG: trigger factor [Planctomycetes bacterium]|nr:trigger factor [Planctomycetota bacterium]
MAPATEEKKKLEPKSEIADVGPCKLNIKVEVGADKVHERIESKYRELTASTELPGFRKGHVPRPLLERKYGKEILAEIKFELLTSSFEEVKEERHLEPLGEPDLDPEKITLQDNAPFTYEITIEVKPIIEVKNYAGLKVKKVEATVTDADVEAELQELRQAHAEWTPFNGPAEPGDQLIGDFELRVDGEVKDKSENVALTLNEQISMYGASLPEFHKSLVGHRSGETIEIPLTVPAGIREAALAGRSGVIALAIKSVKRRTPAELTPEFAKTFDMDSIDELREEIRKRLSREKERDAQAAQAQEVLDQILRENDFPLPEGLITASTEEAARRLRARMLLGGASEEEIRAALEAQEKESRAALVRALRERFVLEHIAGKERIFVTEDDVDERIQQLATQAGRHPHEMRVWLEDENLMIPLRRNMREEVVKEFLLSKAVVE